MTIETKYNIGDKVWFMYDNTVQSDEIYSIRCDVWLNGNVTERYKTHRQTLRYKTHRQTLDKNNDNYIKDISFGIEQIFSTKQALLNSL